MHCRLLISLVLLCVVAAGYAQASRTDSVVVEPRGRFEVLKSRIRQRIADKMNEPYDTIHDKDYWLRALKHGKVDFRDSTIHYPKFIRFCYKTYMWGDRTFNSYDTAYVTGTGKNWKLILGNNYWGDVYEGMPTRDTRMSVRSPVISNLGLTLSFMAVSVGYTMNISNLARGKRLSNKLNFSFTCARFTADAYYMENNSDMLLRFTDSDGKKYHVDRFSGVKRKSYGLAAYYFFNNRRYAQAAAYCFSKYQRRSAGSFLAGVSLYHNDLRVVKEELPPEAAELREVWTAQKGLPRFLYNDFCLLFGYGHNWALGRKWLINATLTPYLGYRHFIRTDINDPASAFSLNLRLRVGVVYNHKRFFVGLHNLVDMHRYRSEQYRLYNGLIDISLLAGIRF